MPPRWLALAAAALLAGCASPPEPEPAPASGPVAPRIGGERADLPTPAEAAAFQMSGGVVVDAERGAGEASILVDPDGRVFVAAPFGSGSARGDALWRSLDGLAFQSLGLPTFPFGGGDTDLEMDADGTLYMPGQWGLRAPLPEAGYPGSPYPFCESVATSEDLGETWTVNPVACVVPGAVDRPWVATVGADVAYMTFNQAGFGTSVVRSSDSGRTWAPAKVPAELLDGSRRGNLVSSRDGALYTSHTLDEGPGVWVSEDGDRWSLRLAARTTNPVENVFPVVAVDDVGTVYLAWSEFLGVGQGFDVRMTRSTDRGETWAPPVKVNTGAKMAIMPWIVAGGEGRVALVWYETSELSVAEGASEDAAWYAHVAVSYDALGDEPRFVEVRLGADPVKRGPVCLDGGGCAPAARRLLDFVEITLGPDGTVHTVITKEVAAEEPVRNVYFRQTAGPRLR